MFSILQVIFRWRTEKMIRTSILRQLKGGQKLQEGT